MHQAAGIGAPLLLPLKFLWTPWHLTDAVQQKKLHYCDFTVKTPSCIIGESRQVAIQPSATWTDLLMARIQPCN